MTFSQLQYVNPAVLKDVLIVLIALAGIGLAIATFVRSDKPKISNPASITLEGGMSSSDASKFVTISACNRLHDITGEKIERIETDLRSLAVRHAEQVERLEESMGQIRFDLVAEFREVRKEINGLILAVGRVEGSRDKKRS